MTGFTGNKYERKCLTIAYLRDKIVKPHIVGFLSCALHAYGSETENMAGVKRMYAIIETGGKQYRVQNGDTIYVEKLNAEVDEVVTFDKVVAISDGELKVGTPYVDGAVVKGTVLKNGKGKKITVFTYKPKKSSSRKMGHRQPYTKVQINEIG